MTGLRGRWLQALALSSLAMVVTVHGQELAPRLDDADIGSSYALRKSLLWFDREIPQRGVYGAAYVDLDRDGRMDVVTVPVNFAGGGAPEPIRVTMNTASGFVDQTATRVTVPGPGIVHARETIAGDFNGDGWVDVFVAGHGYDQPPFPGEFPHLFLNNGNGTLRYDNQLESMVGFDHGAASGDIDRDGDLDILVVRQHHVHFLINDGTAKFTRDDTRLPAELEWKNYFTGELVDVDRDGFLDVILGGHEHEGAATVVYWGEAGGSFSSARKTILPAVPGKDIVLAYGAEDIDGDGDRDLVLSRTDSSPFYAGRYLQVLVQTQVRSFVDETAARITQDTTKPWIDYLRLQDINGDQRLDILHDDRSQAVHGEAAWTNNGLGVFTPYAGPVTPAPTLEIGDASIVEGNAGTTMLSFPVRSSQPLVTAIAFDAFTENGSAWAGGDFEPTTALAQAIAPLQRTGSFQVPVIGEPWIENHENMIAVIGNVSGAVPVRVRATGRILNDDLATLNIWDAWVNEGPAGQVTMTFVVDLSYPLPTPVTFNIATSNGSAVAGTDYVARAQTGRLIDAGRTRAVFEVAVVGDTTAEPTETFTVSITGVTGALAGDLTATGTVFDEDPAPAPATLSRSQARAPADASCARLRADIDRLEARVASGALAERAGIRHIFALERKAGARGCR